MSINIQTKQFRVSIGSPAARRVVVDGGTTRLIRAGQQGPRGPAGPEGEDGPAGPSGIDAAGQIAPIPFGWGDAARVVYTAERAGVLTIARIQYTTAFNDPAATVIVGTADVPDAVIEADWNLPASLYEFENSPDLPLAEGDTIILTINPGAASAGAGLLFLTFLPTE